ncbi:2'-5' RNA ligase family protein [Paucibacter sp. JuS9]|uniref:2'-5' RNA ligase family protein n=1 Tax=Roseateles TaxID=93681 RepID=UPI002FE61EEB
MSAPPAAAKPARPTDRLFFALRPDAATVAAVSRRLDGLRKELGLKGRPLLAEHLHISLHHVGDFESFPADLVHRLLEAAQAVHAPAVPICLDALLSFGRTNRRNNPLALLAGEPLEPLRAFHRSLGVHLQSAGITGLQGRFTPHLTLLYDDALIELRAIEPLRWTATEFMLIDRLIGQTRQVVLGRWPLHA